jgi:hypothetical protein
MDVNRQWYTEHGLHLNGLGKAVLSINLALRILSLLKKEINLDTNIIALRHYEVES